MADDWTDIDERIIQARILPALKLIREQFGGDLREAIDLLNGRYLHLREARADDFTVGPEDYGRGVYT
ncbi:hypothetical protein [Streptosporangium amethystogenes]|uniref:hypothetical protein n=1 Tax=Streptosporangium amethystogenes TaxID=2002 RepID=UPI0004CC5A45|nr:hypothetical protein [Streptosporangium amethystogenes]